MKKEKIKNICKFISGYAWNTSTYGDSGEYPIIRIQNIGNINQPFIYFTGQLSDKHIPFIIEKGDVLLSLSGSIKIEKYFGPKGLLNQRIVKIVPKNGNDLNWISWQLKFLIRKITSLGKLSLVNNVSTKDIEELEVSLPNPTIQTNIAQLLDQAEALCKLRKSAIVQLEEFKKSVFLSLCASNAADYEKWQPTKIKDLVSDDKNSMRSGPFGSNLKHEEFKESGDVKVLGIDNTVNNTFNQKTKRFITLEKYKELKNYTIRPKDVIITIMGTIGRTAVIPDDIGLAINTKYLAAITLNKEKANPYFVAYSIHSNPEVLAQLNAKAKGAIMSGLNLTIIKDIKIKKPPIDLQNQFEKIYHEIETARQEMAAQLKEAEDLLAKLMQEAFSGNLEVKMLENDELEDLFDELDLGDDIYVNPKIEDYKYTLKNNDPYKDTEKKTTSSSNNTNYLALALFAVMGTIVAGMYYAFSRKETNTADKSIKKTKKIPLNDTEYTAVELNFLEIISTEIKDKKQFKASELAYILDTKDLFGYEKSIKDFLYENIENGNIRQKFIIDETRDKSKNTDESRIYFEWAT